MVMSVEQLAPMIHQILSAPDTDLSTVSAKRVRKQLVELDSDITLEFVKQNKDAIDKLIGSIFESLNSSDSGAGFRTDPSHASANGNGKRKRGGNGRETEAKNEREDSQGEDDRGTGEEEDEPGSPSLATPPVTKKAKKAGTRALTDEEYARQLSSEINQRPSRGSRKANGSSKKGASRTPKKKKSRAQIEDSDEDEEGEGSSQAKISRKKSGSGSAKGGFAKEYSLSEPLAVVINAQQLSRPQVVKKLWEYIKSRDLQNPQNRQEILCDDAMRAIFNADKVDMFTMNKILGQHLYEPEP